MRKLNLKKRFKSWAAGQLASNEQVKPEHRWDEKSRSFYLNSEWGLLCYKPKDTKELTDFRNKYINEFDWISKSPDHESRRLLFYRLYQKVKALKRARYRANLRTRVEVQLWSLKNLL